MTQPQPKKSDLGVRTLSAIVMVAVAGTALWLGGVVWMAFVGTVAAAVLWEWQRLVYAIAGSLAGRVVWLIAGIAYIGLATGLLLTLRLAGVEMILLIAGAVIATDVGAYFAGRTIGGPKIAPRISPSKTWSGLAGGMLGAGLGIAVVLRLLSEIGRAHV